MINPTSQCIPGDLATQPPVLRGALHIWLGTANPAGGVGRSSTTAANPRRQHRGIVAVIICQIELTDSQPGTARRGPRNQLASTTGFHLLRRAPRRSMITAVLVEGAARPRPAREACPVASHARWGAGADRLRSKPVVGRYSNRALFLPRSLTVVVCSSFVLSLG